MSKATVAALIPSMSRRSDRYFQSLEAAEAPEELALPGFHFHRLTGDRRGYFAVTVRANWRITFRFEQGRAYDVHLEDYH